MKNNSYPPVEEQMRNRVIRYYIIAITTFALAYFFRDLTLSKIKSEKNIGEFILKIFIIPFAFFLSSLFPFDENEISEYYNKPENKKGANLLALITLILVISFIIALFGFLSYMYYATKHPLI